MIDFNDKDLEDLSDEQKQSNRQPDPNVDSALKKR